MISNPSAPPHGYGMAQRPSIDTGRFYGVLIIHKPLLSFLANTWVRTWGEAPIHIHEEIIRGESGLWLHRLLHLHQRGLGSR